MELSIVDYKNVTEASFLDYIEEWEKSGEKIVPYSARRAELSFQELLMRWSTEESDEVYKNGFVPATLYFLIDNNRRILGAIHFRHELNDKLLNNGGHIGYGIRPTERKKGYATVMLNLLLANVRLQGYEKVLITCDDDNIGSARTIEKCNGLLLDKVEFDGKMTRRYWVNFMGKESGK